MAPGARRAPGAFLCRSRLRERRVEALQGLVELLDLASPRPAPCPAARRPSRRAPARRRLIRSPALYCSVERLRHREDERRLRRRPPRRRSTTASPSLSRSFSASSRSVAGSRDVDLRRASALPPGMSRALGDHLVDAAACRRRPSPACASGRRPPSRAAVRARRASRSSPRAARRAFPRRARRVSRAPSTLADVARARSARSPPRCAARRPRRPPRSRS